MSNLTPAELKLASKLLELAAETFSNHSCNDFDITFLPLSERREIMRGFERWNGSPDDYYEDDVDWFMDSALMAYLSHRLAECDRT